MTITYTNKAGNLVTRKVPKSATHWNGPLNCLWRTYDCNGRGQDMYQDSWGRPV